MLHGVVIVKNNSSYFSIFSFLFFSPPADGGGSNAKRGRTSSSSGKGKGEMVGCSHILCKHRGSRNPNSWKEKNISRTEEEALEIIEKHRASLVAQERSFVSVAFAVCSLCVCVCVFACECVCECV